MRVVVRGEGLAAAIELLRPILVELSEAHVEGTGRWREGGEGGIRSCRWGVAMMSVSSCEAPARGQSRRAARGRQREGGEGGVM